MSLSAIISYAIVSILLTPANVSGVPDACDLAAQTSVDCQPDDVPDECQLSDVTVVAEYGPCSPDATNGEAWCWGHNEEGMAGNGTYLNVFTPTRVLPPF